MRTRSSPSLEEEEPLVDDQNDALALQQQHQRRPPPRAMTVGRAPPPPRAVPPPREGAFPPPPREGAFPPPPPREGAFQPLTASRGVTNVVQGQAPNRHDIDAGKPPDGHESRNDWILNVRLVHSFRDVNDAATMQKLHMLHMTVDTLSASLSQMVWDVSVACTRGPNTPLLRSVVGLYCESTRTFVSLQYIVSLTDPQQQSLAYSVEPPPVPEPPPPRQSWYRWIPSLQIPLRHWFIQYVIPLSALVMVHQHHETMTQQLHHTVETLYTAAIERPLDQLYRNGPWFLAGWEGLDTATICSRITQHGDTSYWSAQPTECHAIVAHKQVAWTMVARPLLVAVWGMTLWLTIRSALSVWHVVQTIRRVTQPARSDMAEVYHALHVLARQFQPRHE